MGQCPNGDWRKNPENGFAFRDLTEAVGIDKGSRLNEQDCDPCRVSAQRGTLRTVDRQEMRVTWNHSGRVRGVAELSGHNYPACGTGRSAVRLPGSAGCLWMRAAHRLQYVETLSKVAQC